MIGWGEYLTIQRNIHTSEVYQSDTAERNNIDNYPPEYIQKKAETVAPKIEEVRAAVNKHFPRVHPKQRAALINSWYRCPQLNAAVGGSAMSDHMAGDKRSDYELDHDVMGVDIRFNGVTPEKVCWAVVKENIDFDKMCPYNSMTHFTFPIDRNGTRRKFTKGWKRYNGDYSEFLK